jgi:hypothetical protein
MARPLSTGLRDGAIGMGRGAGAGRGDGAGDERAAGGAEAAGAGACAATGAAEAGVAAATAAGEGILIVGEAVGFGGRLMRTVSFFGWTLPDSEGLVGTAPEGGLGVFSAIKSILVAKLKLALAHVKCLLWRLIAHGAALVQPTLPPFQARSRAPVSRSPR